MISAKTFDEEFIRELPDNGDKYTEIDLNYIPLGFLGVAKLAKIIPHHLTSLYLIECVAGAGMTRLAAVLQKTPLRELNVRSNMIDDDTGATLIRLLPPTIEKLDIGKNNLGEKSALALGKRLGDDGCILKELLLDENQLPIPKISKSLSSNRSLTFIDLGYLDLGGDSIRTLFQDLKTNETLRSIALSGNRLTMSSVRHMAQYAQTNLRLAKLYLDDCRITNQAIWPIVELLRTPASHISYLDLTNNPFNGLVFHESIYENGRLLYLFVDNLEQSHITDRNNSAFLRCKRAADETIRCIRRLYHHQVPRELRQRIYREIVDGYNNPIWWDTNNDLKRPCIRCKVRESAFMDRHQPEDTYCAVCRLRFT